MTPPLWAKLNRDATTGVVTSWHSLVDHSADVAAVFETLLAVPVVAHRLACLSQVEELPTLWRNRLTAYVFLHDLGKANRGFRRRWHKGARSIGHIAPAVYLCQYEAQRLSKVLPIETIAGWGGDAGAFLSILAHHG